MKSVELSLVCRKRLSNKEIRLSRLKRVDYCLNLGGIQDSKRSTKAWNQNFKVTNEVVHFRIRQTCRHFPRRPRHHEKGTLLTNFWHSPLLSLQRTVQCKILKVFQLFKFIFQKIFLNCRICKNSKIFKREKLCWDFGPRVWGAGNMWIMQQLDGFRFT